MLKKIAFFKINCMIIISLGLLTACSSPIQEVAPVEKVPFPFEQAVQKLSSALLLQLQNSQGVIGLFEQTAIVLDPFVDANTGEVIEASREIEKLLMKQAQQYFKKYTLTRITAQNLQQAHYIISGTIKPNKMETSPVSVTTVDTLPIYQLSSAVIHKQTGKIVAQAEVWVADRNLNYAPTASYQDSPVYIKDKRVDSLVTTVQKPAGELAEEAYYQGLTTQALLVEAESLYEKGDYQKALLAFALAEKREDGKMMRTFAGSYETHLKLGDLASAKQAFRQLLESSLREIGRLNVKFLFSVNSTEFIEDSALRKQYALWLEEIGNFFKQSQECFHVVGHSSHTGRPEYNKELSLKRAEKVQDLLKVHFPELIQQTKAVGKGFENNIVGSGSDDSRDVIDRRVEFVVVECSQLESS